MKMSHNRSIILFLFKKVKTGIVCKNTSTTYGSLCKNTLKTMVLCVKYEKLAKQREACVF
jgi:hypothetical protein